MPFTPFAPELNSWCNMLNPGYLLQYLIFFIQTLTTKPEREREKRGKPQQGCTKIAIIGQSIWCVISELHPPMKHVCHSAINGLESKPYLIH
jgi:hypothetical protein